MMAKDFITIFKITIPKPIAYTYALSILYNVSFFMQLFSTPFVIKSLGISDADNGLIQTLFGVLQMIGGPLFGYCIQKFGIRYSIMLCYLSTMLSGFLLFTATDFTHLVLSRIPVLFMHGQQSHQTLLSALTQPGKERTNAFGRMGLTFGIGFIITPVINIISTKFISQKSPFVISAVLCLLPIFMLEKLIPREKYEATKNAENKEHHVVMNISNTIRILSKPGVLNVLLKKNGPVAPALLIFAILNLYMINEFQMSADLNHGLQLFTGVFIMFSNGFGVIWLRRKFDENTMLYIGTFSFLLAYALFHFFSFMGMFFIIMPFLSLGMSVIATVADSLLTALVEEKEQGLILGVSTSLNSFVRTISPALAGYVLDAYGFNMLATIGFVSTSLVLSILYVWPLDVSLLRKAKEHTE